MHLTRIADYVLGRCSHREYYAQFVNESVKNAVLRFIGKELIMNSKDEHFNDIPLKKWDDISTQDFDLAITFTKVGDGFSLAGKVCVLKEAAKQIKENNQS